MYVTLGIEWLLEMQQMPELLGSYFGSTYFLSIHISLEREEIGLKNTACEWKTGQNMIAREKKGENTHPHFLQSSLKVNT